MQLYEKICSRKYSIIYTYVHIHLYANMQKYAEIYAEIYALTPRLRATGIDLTKKIDKNMQEICKHMQNM